MAIEIKEYIGAGNMKKVPDSTIQKDPKKNKKKKKAKQEEGKDQQ